VTRIAGVFSQPRHKALLLYITVGYPSIEATLKVAPLLAGTGCDLIELGIPFSDPLADGTTIQRVSFRALQNGVTPGLCLKVAGELRKQVDIPLVFMTYFNPVLSYGLTEFCDACATAGIDGLIVPDLLPEEGSKLGTTAARHGIDLIYLLAPTSTDKRIRLVAEQSQGFIYLVSVAGVTGAREQLPADLKAFAARVRKVTAKPLCVGFGISSPSQASQIAAIADGIIVGSQLLKLLEADDSMVKAKAFVEELRTAIDSPAEEIEQ
jgi:tryptophan synthase alpha chain